MPNLDVSEVLLDPDIADVFDVVRRAEAVGDDGRATTKDSTYRNIIGVVTTAEPGAAEIKDDGQMMPRKISVVTLFRLRGPASGVQPDQIIIGGVTFTVTEVLPFTRFGRGFVEVVATSIAPTSRPPA